MNSSVQKLGIALLVISAFQIAHGQDLQIATISNEEPNATAVYYEKLKNDLNAPYYRYDLRAKRAICKPTAQEHAALVAMAQQKQDQQVLTHLQTNGARTQHPLIEAWDQSLTFVEDHKVHIGLLAFAGAVVFVKGAKNGKAVGYRHGFTVGYNEGKKGRCFVDMQDPKNRSMFIQCGCEGTHKVCMPAAPKGKGDTTKHCEKLWPIPH